MNETANTLEGSASYQRLSQQQSLDEILETAMGFEQAARDFYTDLFDRVSKPLRGLVQTLADEEAEHYNLFMLLRERSDIQQHIGERINTPASDHEFSDYTQLPELGDQPTDQEVLRYALGREQAAMQQYTSLARAAPQGPIADLFEYLAKEELQHLQKLEKLYQDILHRGAD